MPKQKPIRIIVPKLHMSQQSRNDRNDIHSATSPSSVSFDQRTISSPRPHRTHRTHRTPRSSHSGRSHRRSYSQPQPANPIQGMSTPVYAPQAIPQFPTPVASPPFRDGPSPSSGPALLPGGGIQVPQSLHFTEEDQGHYRHASDDNIPGNPGVLGRMDFGMFKRLKKIPAAIVRAGRSYGPRNHENPQMSPVPETLHESERGSELPMTQGAPVQDEVETYIEFDEASAVQEEALAREEQLLHQYNQQKRLRRDRAFKKRSHRVREPPPPQPILLPGAHSPRPSAVTSQIGRSQVEHSQAGRSEIHPAALEARLEQEEIRQELEALADVQERGRDRHQYASDAVKQPMSTLSSSSLDRRYATHGSSTAHRRVASVPGLPTQVYSRWAEERDAYGNRLENRPDPDSVSSNPIAALLRVIRQIRDMPWVGDRVAADYVPGGYKARNPRTRSYISSPGSDSSYSSMLLRSTYSGSPLSADGAGRPPVPPKAAQTWYTTGEEILELPDGVDPPPGFIPYPFPAPQGARSVLSAGSGGPASASSHTHIEEPPSVTGAPPASSYTSGPGYLNGEAYRYMPAEASRTGRPYIFVPIGNGQHQPLLVPEMNQHPGAAYVYSHPGPPNFVPAPR
ncbi:hypothetical protein K439DRAFT_498166 [Ramaria rubella]|nr:hypothetical protein K439DRAFT_498166 [Ramaria rubella]